MRALKSIVVAAIRYRPFGPVFIFVIEDGELRGRDDSISTVSSENLGIDAVVMILVAVGWSLTDTY